MDQVTAKKELQTLIKTEELKNKTCIDCSNPNPQWASVSFAVFLCLQCAGTHRGFGVHISFVRSVSMDTWQEEQIRRMKIGGNAPFKEFMQAYSPAEEGGYTAGMNPHETYHSWAAAQYKDKLNAELEGKPWSPSPRPADFASPSSGTNSPNRPSSAQGLRKSRASTRSATGSNLRQSSSSPAPFSNSTDSPPIGGAQTFDSQKAANESFFASLGSANAQRSADLPPSQGGRYQGFGSTPSPSAGSSHPSYGLSSAAAPSLSDFQENPGAALSKGWSLLSTVVLGASRVVHESVVQPGLEKVRDPVLQASVKGYVSEASKRATALGQGANEWGRAQLGVDVAGQVGALVDTVKDRVNGPGYEGYGALATRPDGEGWGDEGRYQDEDDFFGEFEGERKVGDASSGAFGGGNTVGESGTTAPTAAASTVGATKRNDGWDEWEDF